MRRLIGLLCVVAALTACKRKPDAPPEEVPAQLLSFFEVNDPKATVQMTEGFYNLEGNTWRWVAPRFSVVLARPAGSSALHLEAKITVPEVILKATGPVTVSASAAGVDLPPQTYSAAGDHVYAADFSVADDRAAVGIDFRVDKHVKPGGEDDRELSVIVTSVGLTAK